jgi:hypothetical protein
MIVFGISDDRQRDWFRFDYRGKFGVAENKLIERGAACGDGVGDLFALQDAR